MPDLTLTLEELAAALGKSPATVRTQLCRTPRALPTPLRIPGNRRLVWRRIDVEAFLAAYAPATEPVVAAMSDTSKRSRGRPRKIAHEGGA